MSWVTRSMTVIHCTRNMCVTRKRAFPIDVPKNYYPEDDDTQKPCLEWRAHCNILYSNWLNYFVYQITPYEL